LALGYREKWSIGCGKYTGGVVGIWIRETMAEACEFAKSHVSFLNKKKSGKNLDSDGYEWSLHL